MRSGLNLMSSAADARRPLSGSTLTSPTSTPERSFALETWAPSGHCSLKLCLFATVLLIVLSCPLLQSYRRVYTACFADARERAEKSRVLRWAAPRTRTRSADGWWLAHAHPWPSPARPQAGKGRGRGHRARRVSIGRGPVERITNIHTDRPARMAADENPLRPHHSITAGC